MGKSLKIPFKRVRYVKKHWTGYKVGQTLPKHTTLKSGRKNRVGLG